MLSLKKIHAWAQMQDPLSLHSLVFVTVSIMCLNEIVIAFDIIWYINITKVLSFLLSFNPFLKPKVYIRFFFLFSSPEPKAHG